MELPFYQIDSELFQSAIDLAVLLEWDESKAFHGLARMFVWALKRCPDDAPPSHNDTVRGAGAAKLLAHAAGWTGDAKAFVDACEEIQPPVLQRTQGGIRVRGLKRYDDAWHKARARSAAAKKAADARWGNEADTEGGDASGEDPDPGGNANAVRPHCEPHAGPVRPDAYTETETENRKKLGKDLSPTPLKNRSPTGFPQAAAEKPIWDRWQEQRRARGLPGERPLGEKWNDWLRKYEAQYGRERLERCFEVYLADPWSRQANAKGRCRNATVALFISPGVFASRIIQTREEFAQRAQDQPPLRVVATGGVA
jgi:hypothetical protein